MESLYLLIPLSIILAFFMGYFFWWSTKNGQFDDLKGPAHRILMDNDDIINEPEAEEAVNEQAEEKPTESDIKTQTIQTTDQDQKEELNK